MIAAGHTSIGVIIAEVVKTALPSAPLWQLALVVLVVAFLSHYLSDLAPHGHYKVNMKHPALRDRVLLFTDVVAVALVFIAIITVRQGFGAELLLSAIGIIGAQLTDVWDWVIVDRGWVGLKGWVARHRRFHQLIHWHDVRDATGKRKGLPIGWWDVWQVAAIGLALYLVLT